MKKPCSSCENDPTMAMLCTLIPGCTSRKKCSSYRQSGICATKAFHEQSFIAEYFKIEAERSNWAVTCAAVQVLVLEMKPDVPFAQLKIDLTLKEDQGHMSLLVALTPEMCPRRTKYVDSGVMLSRFNNNSEEYIGGRYDRQLLPA